MMFAVTCLFNSHEKCECVIISGWPGDCLEWQFNVVILLDTKNVINVKLCIIVLLRAFFTDLTTSVTLAILQGHSTVEKVLMFRFN